MATDSNRLAMKVLRALISAAKPQEIEIGDVRVSCSISPGTQRPWPTTTLAGLDRDQDGPGWVPSIIVDCAWPEGKCRLFVDVEYWSTGRYLHDLCLKVGTERRQLVFVNVANEIEGAEEGGRVGLPVRFFITRAAAAIRRLNGAMRDVLRESKLPILGGASAELCEIELPSTEILPSAEGAFRRLLQIALLKLDFLDRGRTTDRGRPLVDLTRWLTPEELAQDGDDAAGDGDDGDEEAAASERQYWAGGYGEPLRLEKFLAENTWKIGSERNSDNPAAKRTWKRFAQIRIGDYFAIKGYTGVHELTVHYVGEVTSIDAAAGQLGLRRLSLPLYSGKAPSKQGAGNWQDTLVPVTRPDVITTLFGVSTDDASGLPAAATQSLDLPLNLIYFGPPGTGKTYRLTKEHIPSFQRVPDKEALIEVIASQHDWFEVVAIALADLGRAKVPQLKGHPLIKAKHLLNPVKDLSARLWATLQTFTIESSKTVNYGKRAPVQYFDKTADSEWFIAQDLPEELQAVVRGLKAPPDQHLLDDFTFVTFHQAYGYEDFIEGIRPNIDDNADEASLSYRLEDGAFLRAARAALRLAGFKGSLHDFCGMSRKQREVQLANARPYAVFIDEINRGNVARIFGELITLLEEDKRLGEDNEVIVQLPYSKKLFGVPPNLHIIGTMNTADRSVEALDAALRRRFEFRELSPAPERLEFTVEGDINPELMLRTINRRLEKLYDRDHCIGHAYLMSLQEEPSLERLKHVFKYKVIPLLQEYFFGDWGKIGLVLGRDFVRRRDFSGTPFADFEHDDHDALAEHPTWELVDVAQLSSFAFRRIYEQVTDA